MITAQSISHPIQARRELESVTDRSHYRTKSLIRFMSMKKERNLHDFGLREFALISYEKFFELYVAHGNDRLIVVTVDENIEFQLLSEIANRVKTLQ